MGIFQFWSPEGKSQQATIDVDRRQKITELSKLWDYNDVSKINKDTLRLILVIKGHKLQVSKSSKDSNSKSPTEMKNDLFHVLTAVKTWKHECLTLQLLDTVQHIQNM